MLKIASATLELTNVCNLRCEHCFNASHPEVERVEMDLDTTRMLLQDLKDNNSCNLDELWLTGGEPLLHSKFCEMMELFYSFGHKSIVVTNGIHKEAYLQKLIDIKQCVRRVHLSLEGLKESNDHIRGEGVFDHLINITIPALKKAAMHVCVTVHLRKQNKHEIQALTELIIDELDCDLKLGILRPIGRARNNLEHDMLSPAELYECIKETYRMKKKYKVKRIWHDWEIFTEDVKFYIQDFHGRFSCPAGMQSIVAYTPEYDVYPCVQLRFPFFRLGNFKDTKNLEALLTTPEATKVYETLSNKSDQCNECSYFKRTCHGGCPAISYGLKEEVASISEMDPYCFAPLVKGCQDWK